MSKNTPPRSGVPGKHTPRRDAYPLIWAALRGRAADVGHRLAAGDDPDACDADGVTGLMAAVKSGSLDTARQFIEGGADVNRRDHLGKTALAHAASTLPAGRSHDMARLLLESDADPNTRDANDATPLMVATWYDDTVMAVLLIEHGAIAGPSLTATLSWMSAAANSAAIRALLRRGDPVEGRDMDGDTPLLAAARRFRGNAVFTVLLQAHADPLARDADGKTALDLMERPGNRAAIVALDDTLVRPTHVTERAAVMQHLGPRACQVLPRCAALQAAQHWIDTTRRAP